MVAIKQTLRSLTDNNFVHSLTTSYLDFSSNYILFNFVLFQTETQTGNKYVKAIFKTRKPKFPFPHAMSVIVNNDNLRNSNYQFCHSKIENFDDSKKRKQSIHTCEERQMFSQGTADIILDFCVDYWDGYDVHPLTPSIRFVNYI